MVQRRMTCSPDKDPRVCVMFCQQFVIPANELPA
jgi:hypothetical protein